MKLSLTLTNYSWPDGAPGLAAHLGEVMQAADDASLDTVWVADHLLQADPNSTPEADMLEAYTTLDVLSGGRAVLGIGAGYHLDEARAMGLPLPTTTERFERLEDTLRLATQMWSDDDTPFQGPTTGPSSRSTVRTRSSGHIHRS